METLACWPESRWAKKKELFSLVLTIIILKPTFTAIKSLYIVPHYPHCVIMYYNDFKPCSRQCHISKLTLITFSHGKGHRLDWDCEWLVSLQYVNVQDPS